MRQELVPASGASVQIVESGTGVSKTIYEDKDQTFELPNPLTTDVDGEISVFLNPGRIRVIVKLDEAHEEVFEDVICDCDAIGGGGPTFLKNETTVTITGTDITLPGLILANTQGYAVTCKVLQDITGVGVTAFNLGVSGTGMSNAFSKNGVGLTSGTKTTSNDIKINSPFHLASASNVDVLLTVVGGEPTGGATGGQVKITYWYVFFETT